MRLRMKDEYNQNRLETLRIQFGETYATCKKQNSADWKLFTNCLENLLEALKEFDSLEVNSVIIKMGFTSQFEIEVQKLEAYEKSLKERNMI